MKKSLRFLSIIIVLSFITFLFIGNPFVESKSKEITFDAKTDSFNNLEELENNSPIIVRGIKTDEKETEIYRSEVDGEVNGGFTLSGFKVNNVYKNSQQDTNILVGKEIQITENAYYDKQTNTAYNINGYTNMVKEKEYLLFLIPVDDGKYATRAVTFGKVPLYTQKTTINKSSTLSEDHVQNDGVIESIFKDAREKYKD